MIRKLFTLKWTSGLLCAVLLCVSAVALRAQTDIPDWSKLRAAYDFDSKKAPEVKTERKFSGVGSALHLTYKGPSGSTVTGLFVRPKADGVYPVVLLLHGRGDQKDTMVKYIGEPLVENGLAVLALDAPYHGERKVAGKNPTDALVFAEAVHEGNRDYRAALDWLASRKDVDMKHVGLLGYSMGAMMGAILAGVDDRIGPVVLCVGGDPVISAIGALPPQYRETAYTVSPSLYVGHISPRPLLMLNGTQDQVMAESASKRLYEAAREPKQIMWFDAGHLLPIEDVAKGMEWLMDKVKSPKPTVNAEPKPAAGVDAKP